ncbi:integrase [Paucihalobacter ruber]|uniref:Tyrosine recombinase XerC n=1 Tax=Paucihalobacter ruber TaxID=2567861 RepID=A0A506PPL7_9FLAO|nr:tyrosine-type recombinase/integrase [Paucihalobacter ruber]TPV35519.1 integrase [Paucihalobacter ruber]
MFFAEFKDYLLLEKKYAKHTVTAYLKDLESFSDFLNAEQYHTKVSEVNYSQIRSWIVLMVNTGLSNRSINRKISSLNTYFKYLMKIEQVSTNPLSSHKALKTEKKVQIPFSQKEVETALNEIAFENSFEGLRDRLIIELLYATGMRRSELINLKLSDVDLESDILKVLGKRNKERYIPLIASVKENLKTYLVYRSQITDAVNNQFLFLSLKGHQFSESQVYNTVKKCFSLVTSKVKKSPHMLRHSFATHMLNEGANLNAVKELLGHTSLAATQVYTHSSIAELKKIYQAAHPRNK